MQGGWRDFDYWRERQRDFLGEAEARRLVRAGRPGRTGRLGKYRPLLSSVAEMIKDLGRRVVSSPGAFPPDEEVVSPGGTSGLVEAVFENKDPLVRSSSVIELHREGEGYVIRQVDLGTGDHILYLSTEEPEWAAWIWEQKVHG
jgi:hypothetical protein